MARPDLFREDGLIAPPMSPAMDLLFQALELRRPHPVARHRGWSFARQWWLLHRSLALQPECILELLFEYLVENADPEQVVPLPHEWRPLVQACWRMWSDLARIGLDVNYEVEPDLPLPPNCRRRRTVPRRDNDEDEDDDDWRR
jgi:hypothetical protein